VAVALVRPPLTVITRRDWRGAEHLPMDRGFIACSNHVSHVDPFTFAHFLYLNGCPPRFLAKNDVFKIPVLGRIVAGAGQIPVYRETADAGKAFSVAVDAVRAGECVAIFPEATLTRDPRLWPMVGKTGAARIALTTGCPVIPVAQWGAQDIFAPYGSQLHLLPRRTVRVWAGPPVDLSAFEGLPLDAATLRGATDAILDRLTTMLAELRGEQPPAHRWDPRHHGQPRIGDFHRDGSGAG
ncbi:MAG TPA: lysophospholipid acyltransferase family protein, partial [Kineosporiaceae bacterium]|nr:lysophospholipid acyltransferase family protein [Kineosporiaceae bacterium]